MKTNTNNNRQTKETTTAAFEKMQIPPAPQGAPLPNNALPFALDYDAMEKIGFALYCFEDFVRMRGEYFDSDFLNSALYDFILITLSNLHNSSRQIYIESCYDNVLDMLEQAIKAKDKIPGQPASPNKKSEKKGPQP